MSDECRGELLMRVTHGRASDADRLALSAHLDCCSQCRLEARLFQDFDEVGQVTADDSQRVARVAVLAARAALETERLSSVVPLRVSPRRRLAPAAAALLGFTALSAAAALGTLWFVGPPAQPEECQRAAGAASNLSRLQHAQLQNTETALWQGAQQALAALHADWRSGSPREVPGGTPAATARAPSLAPRALDAHSLYVTANEARRAGRAREAESAYRQLQQQYPAAAEANASRVSFGGLLLGHGRATEALAQYDAYLRGSEQRMRQEALFGRARALDSQVCSAAAEQTWRQLLEDYPRSPYSERARQRLHLSP